VRRPGQNEMRPGRRTLLHVRLSVGLGLNVKTFRFKWCFNYAYGLG
jgi:hypothetical protein